MPRQSAEIAWIPRLAGTYISLNGQCTPYVVLLALLAWQFDIQPGTVRIISVSSADQQPAGWSRCSGYLFDGLESTDELA